MSREDIELMDRIDELDLELIKKVEEINVIIQEKKEILKMINNDEFKKKILSKISHGLRTPLNSIMGFTELLLEEFFGRMDGKQQEILTDIRESADNLLNNAVNMLEGYQKNLKK